MSRDELLEFIRGERYAVQASVSALGSPQAAIVGIVVSDSFELFFDTLSTSRKVINLRQNPAVAFVIGPTGSGTATSVLIHRRSLSLGPGILIDRARKLFDSCPAH